MNKKGEIYDKLLSSRSLQAIHMVIREFNGNRCKDDKDLITEDDFSFRGGVYYLYVETPTQQEFLRFVRRSPGLNLFLT